MNVLNYKTGKGVLNRLQRILETPFHNRAGRFGRAWACELTNGQERIREEFPELVPEMTHLFYSTGPKTVGDLVVVTP